MSGNIETVYVNRLPPKDAVVHLLEAISSCSPEEIKKPNPQPDLHYFEMYWYSKKRGGGVRKNILRLLYPTYHDAVEEREAMFKRLFGCTPDWVDGYYAPQLRSIDRELKISRQNRIALKKWRNL